MDFEAWQAGPEAAARSRAWPQGQACGGWWDSGCSVRAGVGLERQPRAGGGWVEGPWVGPVGALAERQDPGRPLWGARRWQQTRGCGGGRCARGVSRIGSRGAQTPPRREPRLRGWGRPGSPSASHRARRRLPGLPGPRNAVAAAGGAAPARRGEGSLALCPPPEASSAPPFHDGWAAALGTRLARTPFPETALFASPELAGPRCTLCLLLCKSLGLSGTTAGLVPAPTSSSSLRVMDD